jgi:hypothetical protein
MGTQKRGGEDDNASRPVNVGFRAPNEADFSKCPLS